ncbi:MAG: sulfite exporter TauE/SafE family protein [Halofilum sp. (in: g-proteobacteria)]|nr:sulfite exporter TauE/SafE family protein [Halofilum sp. (in: g-proteobacteria)]
MTGLELLAYAALGAVSGTMAGLLGVGGGVIIVPGLALLLATDSVPADRLMQVAVGTSLATIVATSLSSIRAHHRRGAVRWPTVARLTPGIVVGAGLGAAIADWLPTRGLAIVFGAFLVLISLRLALLGTPAPHRQLPGAPGLGAWASASARSRRSPASAAAA